MTEAGHEVRVVPTAAALRFVGAPTWAALSGTPVSSDVWADAHEVPHVRIGKDADVVVVAPATADLIAKAACGIADDLLTNTMLTARCPVVLVPAMHTEMWEHPATQDNVATLRRRGTLVPEPDVGRLTGADTGKGRLPEPVQILELVADVLARGPEPVYDLAGRRVVVSAGGTREFLDPVRFLGNRSSGRQGYELARAAVARGAEVTVVSANVELPDPAGAKVVPVETTQEMHDAVMAAVADADALVMAAAPADFRPTQRLTTKIKRLDNGAPVLQLVENVDILATVSKVRPSPDLVVVGFAAETGDERGSALQHAQAKLVGKGCDLLVVNDVSGGQVFGRPDTEAVILGADGSVRDVPHGAKSELAHVVWDLVAERFADG